MKQTLLLFTTALLFLACLLLFACKKEVITPDTNPGPDPNCQEQKTIFTPDNQPAKVVANLTFLGEIYDFQMLTPDTGYIFGASPINNIAVLLKTTNGGQTFSPSNLQASLTPLGCSFKDVNSGIVTLLDPFACPNCEYRPTYAITHDGGESWTNKTIPGMRGSLYQPRFDAQGRLYAILHLGATATLLVSEDTGEHWDTLFASPEIDFFYQEFNFAVHDDKIYLPGINKRLFVLDKQGNLQKTITTSANFILNFWAFDDQNLIFSNYEGVFKSSNGGNTWEPMPGIGCLGIAFETPQSGVVIQSKGQCGSDIFVTQDLLALTTDGGQSYKTGETTTSNLRYLHFGTQRIGPGKYLTLFGRQLIELNVPQ